MYDINGNQFSQPESVYLPFNWIEPMEIRSVGNRDNWKSLPGNPGFVESLRIGEANFIQMWVELPDAKSRRPTTPSSTPTRWTRRRSAGSSARSTTSSRRCPSSWRSGRWCRRRPRPWPRSRCCSWRFRRSTWWGCSWASSWRALRTWASAGRWARAARSIFLQHLIECELVGLIGGAIGLLLSLGVLAFFNNLFSRTTPGQAEAESFFRLDPTMILAAVLLSLVAGAIAGIYPAWRICSIPPARTFGTSRDQEKAMPFGPIFRAMTRNRARFVLIVAEVALTLAIVANCVSLIRASQAELARESGFDDANLLFVRSRPFAEAFREDKYLQDAVEADARTLRAIPGVRAATNTYFLPWQGAAARPRCAAATSATARRSTRVT